MSLQFNKARRSFRHRSGRRDVGAERQSIRRAAAPRTSGAGTTASRRGIRAGCRRSSMSRASSTTPAAREHVRLPLQWPAARPRALRTGVLGGRRDRHRRIARQALAHATRENSRGLCRAHGAHRADGTARGRLRDFADGRPRRLLPHGRAGLGQWAAAARAAFSKSATPTKPRRSPCSRGRRARRRR